MYHRFDYPSTRQQPQGKGVELLGKFRLGEDTARLEACVGENILKVNEDKRSNECSFSGEFKSFQIVSGDIDPLQISKTFYDWLLVRRANHTLVDESKPCYLDLLNLPWIRDHRDYDDQKEGTFQCEIIDKNDLSEENGGIFGRLNRRDSLKKETVTKKWGVKFRGGLFLEKINFFEFFFSIGNVDNILYLLTTLKASKFFDLPHASEFHTILQRLLPSLLL